VLQLDLLLLQLRLESVAVAGALLQLVLQLLHLVVLLLHLRLERVAVVVALLQLLLQLLELACARGGTLVCRRQHAM